MKSLKNFFWSLTIVILGIVAGCSDFVSSPDISTSNSVTKPEQIVRGDSYTAKYSLNPGQSLFLDSTVTSIRWIKGYSISNCNGTRELYISASNLDQSGTLPCSWRTNSSFMMADLSIQNTSNQKLTVEVYMIGVSSN